MRLTAKEGMDRHLQTKRWLGFGLAAAWATLACGCGISDSKQSAVADFVPTSQYTAGPTTDPVEGLASELGQVIAIDGLKYTLALGEVESIKESVESAAVTVSVSTTADSDDKVRFVASGRTLDVDLSQTVVRDQDGKLDFYVPVSDIVIGDVVTVFLTGLGECAYITIQAGAETAMGDIGEALQGGAKTEISGKEHIQGASYVSSESDENALRVIQTTAAFDSIAISKVGGPSSDVQNSSRYGLNAAFLATDGANVTITDSQIESNTAGSCGIFCYGSGTTTGLSGGGVETAGESSAAIAAAGEAALDAHDVQAGTQGPHSAALYVSQGADAMVNGGLFRTTGMDSPAVLTDSEVSLQSTEVTAAESEAMVLENAGTIQLTDCAVSGAMNGQLSTRSAVSTHNVLIYQPRQSAGESALLRMRGGSLIGRHGDMFYITNTTCDLELDGVQISNRDQLAWLFNVCGNNGSLGWGDAGINGAHADITLRHQNTVGDIRVDSISSMNLHLAEGTTLRGGIRLEANTAASEDAQGFAEVIIDEGCIWSLTGNSEVTTLENNGTIQFNGYTVTLADGTVISS